MGSVMAVASLFLVQELGEVLISCGYSVSSVACFSLFGLSGQFAIEDFSLEPALALLDVIEE